MEEKTIFINVYHNNSGGTITTVEVFESLDKAQGTGKNSNSALTGRFYQYTLEVKGIVHKPE